MNQETEEGKRISSLESLCEEYRAHNRIPAELFDKYQVKRGLRNPDGTGVVAGLTNISNVHGYIIEDEEKTPDEGRLIYRGIDLRELVEGCARDNRFGFEEVEWLLLFGKLRISALVFGYNTVAQLRQKRTVYPQKPAVSCGSAQKPS